MTKTLADINFNHGDKIYFSSPDQWDIFNCQLIDGSFTENILPLIGVSLEDVQKIGNLKVVCTWIALKLL